MLRLGVFFFFKSQVAYSCFAFVMCLLPACLVFCSLSVCWFLEVSEEFLHSCFVFAHFFFRCSGPSSQGYHTSSKNMREHFW